MRPKSSQKPKQTLCLEFKCAVATRCQGGPCIDKAKWNALGPLLSSSPGSRLDGRVNEYLQEGRRAIWDSQHVTTWVWEWRQFTVGFCALHSFVLVAERMASAADASHHHSAEMAIKLWFIFFTMWSVSALQAFASKQMAELHDKVVQSVARNVNFRFAFLNSIFRFAYMHLDWCFISPEQLLSHYVHKHWPWWCLHCDNNTLVKKGVLLTFNSFQI